MASKAVTRVSLDWSKIASRVSSQDLPKINKMKAQFDATGIKVANLPESLPSFDWSYYKARVADPKLVEDIEKNYTAIKIDRPKAVPKRLEDLKLAEQQDQARLKKFHVLAESFVEAVQIVKTKFENMIPVKDMSHEDWTLTFPHWSWSREYPTAWPHLGLSPGLSREEAAAFEQPDPLPYSSKKAWQDWEEKYKKRLYCTLDRGCKLKEQSLRVLARVANGNSFSVLGINFAHTTATKRLSGELFGILHVGNANLEWTK